MLKSTMLSVLAVVGIGGLLWFAKDGVSEGSKAVGSKTTKRVDGYEKSEALPNSANGIAESAPESERHSAQAIQKEKQARLKQLRNAVRLQEERVEERRQVLSSIVRTKGIIYIGNNSATTDGGVDENQRAKSALQMSHQLEQEQIQLQSQIDCLLKYDHDQLMVYAAGLDLPDNVIRDLYPQYLEEKRKLEALKINGLGDTHPTVIATNEALGRLKKQSDEGVVNIRATLQAQLELTTDRFKSVNSMTNENRDEAIKRGIDAQDYVDAKRDFETDQELLQQMKLKLIQDEADLNK